MIYKYSPCIECRLWLNKADNAQNASCTNVKQIKTKSNNNFRDFIGVIRTANKSSKLLSDLGKRYKYEQTENTELDKTEQDLLKMFKVISHWSSSKKLLQGANGKPIENVNIFKVAPPSRRGRAEKEEIFSLHLIREDCIEDRWWGKVRAVDLRLNSTWLGNFVTGD